MLKKLLPIWLILPVLFLLACSSIPKGEGTSISHGSVGSGSLENGRKFPFKGENFHYFSWLSYGPANNAWVHEKVLETSLEAYKECEKTCPGIRFLLMECSDKKGGKLLMHRTHQNGLSIDFGSPMIKNGKPYKLHHYFGIGHYNMIFNGKGELKRNHKIKIDFETMARHILALDKAARKRGLYVRKVILKTDLKDEFYKTESGKKVKKRGIYLVKKLPNLINNAHDDHYHIDFGFL